MEEFIRSSFVNSFIPLLMSALLLGYGYNEKEDIEEIKGLSSARAQAFNNADARGIAIHFTEGAVLMPPGKPSVKGRKAVESYYQSVFDE